MLCSYYKTDINYIRNKGDRMVYRLPNWFVYEEGDSVTVLKNGETGLIVSVEELDVENKTQVVTVKTRLGTESFNSNDLDLKRRLRTVVK